MKMTKWEITYVLQIEAEDFKEVLEAAKELKPPTALTRIRDI